MNILMMTNTFTPHVGGVARSIERFTAEYRRRGHRVMVVAPVFDNMPEGETDVLRVPAIQRFNGSDFSVALKIPGPANEAIEEFQPRIVHSHHPFLIGGAAVRVANKLNVPLIFTHHTMYEKYTHYVLEHSETFKRFVANLSTNYANLCDLVIAPSESVASLIAERGVESPIEVVPTGVETDRFAGGSGSGFRAVMDIPRAAFVVGHVGRLAPEKNLSFLAEAVAAFLRSERNAHFLVIGSGPSKRAIREIFDKNGITDRLHLAGTLDYPVLVSAYRAMDVFAFASTTETQGMVLIEAMAAGVPVVALDAPGVREVVVDRHNGRLLRSEDVGEFSAALQWVFSLASEQREELNCRAVETAKRFGMAACADKLLAQYAELSEREIRDRDEPYEMWSNALQRIKAEWDIMTSVIDAAKTSLTEPDSESLDR
jgi:glycosyltransferase involved in cell wall biosynthesis